MSNSYDTPKAGTRASLKGYKNLRTNSTRKGVTRVPICQVCGTEQDLITLRRIDGRNVVLCTTHAKGII